MTPETMARLVARWVRLYTRNLPTPVAQRRIEELDADLHDQIAHQRSEGTADGRIARSIAARMLRGIAADVAWRRRSNAGAETAARSAVRVALATACVLLVPLVAMQITDGVDWNLADFVIAGVLLGGTGLLLELAVRKPRNRIYRAVTAAIGLAAIVAGNSDDAPGLVLFGCLVVAATAAMAIRSARRRA
jgi:hypothetical protein